MSLDVRKHPEYPTTQRTQKFSPEKPKPGGFKSWNLFCEASVLTTAPPESAVLGSHVGFIYLKISGSYFTDSH